MKNIKVKCNCPCDPEEVYGTKNTYWELKVSVGLLLLAILGFVALAVMR